MSRLREWIVLAVGAASLAVSLELLRRAVGSTSPWFALMVMFDVLGLFALLQPLWLLKLPRFLRKQRAWETKGVYTMLGVPAFGALLRRSALRQLNPHVYLRQCPDPFVVLARIESAEQAHLIASALIIPYIIYACAQGRWGAAAVITLVQTGFNSYPILHLRWSRIRINRLRATISTGRRPARIY